MSERPYPEGVAWDEAWRQRKRADELERRMTTKAEQPRKLKLVQNEDGSWRSWDDKKDDCMDRVKTMVVQEVVVEDPEPKMQFADYNSDNPWERLVCRINDLLMTGEYSIRSITPGQANYRLIGGKPMITGISIQGAAPKWKYPTYDDWLDCHPVLSSIEAAFNAAREIE